MLFNIALEKNIMTIIINRGTLRTKGTQVVAYAGREKRLSINEDKTNIIWNLPCNMILNKHINVKICILHIFLKKK